MAISKTEKNRQDRVGSGDFIYTIEGIDGAPAFIFVKDAYSWLNKYTPIPHTYKIVLNHLKNSTVYFFERDSWQYYIRSHEIV